VNAGEVASGVDITIPLDGLHTVAGTVNALADGHPLGRAIVRLLYADDREKARQISPLQDGSFSFEYVPEGKYIVQVSEAQDAAEKDPQSSPGDQETGTPKTNLIRHYADMEIPLEVLADIDDVQFQLTAVPTAKPGQP
jgi:hypothetical protein